MKPVQNRLTFVPAVIFSGNQTVSIFECLVFGIMYSMYFKGANNAQI
jgi:hypothetical protein